MTSLADESQETSVAAGEGQAKVKTVITALIFVILVAAGGARAQAVYPQTSTAYRQCRELCDALPGARATDLDGEQGTSAADFADLGVAVSNRECFLCGIEGLEGLRAVEHYLGGIVPRARPSLHALMFDPTD